MITLKEKENDNRCCSPEPTKRRTAESPTAKDEAMPLQPISIQSCNLPSEKLDSVTDGKFHKKLSKAVVLDYQEVKASGEDDATAKSKTHINQADMACE